MVFVVILARKNDVVDARKRNSWARGMFAACFSSISKWQQSGDESYRWAVTWGISLQQGIISTFLWLLNVTNTAIFSGPNGNGYCSKY